MCAAKDSSKDCLPIVPCEDSDKNHEKNLFFKAYDKAMAIFVYFPKMSDALDQIQASEESLQEILASVSAESDPEVRGQLRALQKDFRSFIRVGKEFLEECLTMAKYITNEEHVQLIKQELEKKILNKLGKYTDSILSYLKVCSESFKAYEETQRKFEKNISESEKENDTQAKEAKQEVTNAQRNFEEAIVQHKVEPKVLGGCAIASIVPALLTQRKEFFFFDWFLFFCGDVYSTC